MGAFSNMDYELQNSEAAVSDAFTEDGAMDMPQTAPVEPVTASSPTAAPTPAAAASEPATAPNTQSEDEARRAHEAAEAKRKAEWDAKQAEIPKPAAADHEPVVTALSEPDQLFLRVDIVCHENGNDCRYQPINEKTSGIEVLDAGQIDHLHIFTLPFKYNCFTSLYIIPQGTV